MKLSDAFPSSYIAAKDLDGDDRTLTIKSVAMEVIGSGKDAENKLILHFDEEKKGMVLNKTNANTIDKLYGDDTDHWIGKKITLYATEVEFQGETMLGLRVRLTPPKSKSGNGGMTSALLNAAKVEAFKAMQAKMPGAAKEAVIDAIKDAVSACYPGQKVDQLGTVQWRTMINRDFAPVENPVSQELTVSADEEPPF